MGSGGEGSGRGGERTFHWKWISQKLGRIEPTDWEGVCGRGGVGVEAHTLAAGGGDAGGAARGDDAAVGHGAAGAEHGRGGKGSHLVWWVEVGNSKGKPRGQGHGVQHAALRSVARPATYWYAD